jgi:rubrerythrin
VHAKQPVKRIEEEVNVEFDSVDSVLDFAIKNEQAASDFYTDLASKMEKPQMKKIFEDFAAEERGHKAKLESVKGKEKGNLSKAKVLDLKIGDYLVEQKPNTTMDYQSALILAMKQEKAAFRLYSDLAASADDAGTRELFMGLAQEEAKHKLRFEIAYDEDFLRDN